MTEFIVRLEKEQIRQERRKLLSDDVYVLPLKNISSSDWSSS